MAAAQEERFTRKKHDAGFPSRAVAYCLREAGITGRRARSRRLLREAARQVRAAARDLRRLRAEGPAVVPDGAAALAERQAVDGRRHPSRVEGYEGRGAVRRAPRVARRLGVLSVAVRAGRDPDDGRRRRVGDLVDRRRPRPRDRDAARAAVSALARPAVFGVHLLHRLQGELRRIQGHGARAVRRAEVRPDDQRPPARDPRRRQPVDEHGVLHLPHGPDDDRRRGSRRCSTVPRASRRAS